MEIENLKNLHSLPAPELITLMNNCDTYLYMV